MANIALFTLGRELDANGVTVPGALAYFYEAGTTTPLTAYSDSATTIAHANPLVADAGGLFAPAYITASSAKVVTKKPDGTTLRTLDPCPVISTSAVGAAAVSFSPTVEIPETNVQAAIEAAAASAAAGFDAFGLGVTGNAPTLANIDATNIGVGFYRTTAATTGTFPTGITASSTSIVRVERETSALAYMELLDDSGKIFYRFMIASSWGAWRHKVTMPVGPTTGDIVHWSGTAWAAISPGTTGQFLRSNGAAAPSMQASTVSGAVALTGLTTINTNNIFNGGNIPSWVTRIEVCFTDCATASSGADMLVKLRLGSTTISTGYFSGSDGEGITATSSTAGFRARTVGTSYSLNGVMTIVCVGGLAIETHALYPGFNEQSTYGAGRSSTSMSPGVNFDQLEFSNTAGVAFTNGSVFILLS